MKNTIEFLENFLEVEKEAITASDIPDLENFNSKLEFMNEFLVDSLKNTFGMIPITELSDADYYERVKDYPAPTKRHIFRIDEYKTGNNTTIYLCFISERTPDDWKEFHTLLILEKIEKKMLITSKFTFSDDETDSTKRFYFGGGEKNFMTIIKDKYLLNKKVLGTLIKVNRLLEPAQDEESMIGYNSDEL